MFSGSDVLDIKKIKIRIAKTTYKDIVDILFWLSMTAEALLKFLYPGVQLYSI